MQAPLDVSVWQRVQLGHAALQVVAERAGVDLLHLKGPALDPVLAPVPRNSTDADVLVRPSHLSRFLEALGHTRWELVADFPEGSPFEHATTYWHPEWGYMDVHQRFPGLRGDETVFDRLWRDRGTRVIAGRDCPVPSVVAQRLVLILHAARKDSPHATEDVRRAWTEADEETRAAVRRLAGVLGGEVFLAGGTGHLDDYRGTPEWRMLSAFTGQGSRLGEWRARLLLAPGWRAKAHVVGLMVRVNRPRLTMELGRHPTRADLARAYGRRIGRGVQEVLAATASRLGRRPR